MSRSESKRQSGRWNLFSAACMLACIVVSACEPKEPEPPALPSMAPLAKAPAEESPPVGGMLPQGHPPIGEAPAPPDETQADALPPGHPPIGMPAANDVGDMDGEEGDVEAPTQFVGISLTPPDGWIAVQRRPTGGAFSTVPDATFRLPAKDVSDEDVAVRLTHFPRMKNVPLEMNLNRWYGQFTQPDGKNTKDVAVTESFEVDGVSVTLVDISGTLVQGNVADYRMMAAVIAHDKGPHFLKVTGPTAAVGKWRDSVVAYLKSAKVTQ